MGHQVVRVLYRTLLKHVRKEGLAPVWAAIAHARTNDLCGLPPSQALPPFDVSTIGGASTLLRWIFQKNSTLPLASKEVENALDKGFEALQLFQILKVAQRRRALQENRTGVHFSLGHVVKHRHFGYSGVIYGWDPECTMPIEMLIKKQMVNMTKQPFYYILPNQPNGRSTNSKYVAQGNVEILVGGRVENININKYFVGYDRQLGRYIPIVHLRYLYPDTYSCNKEHDPSNNVTGNTSSSGVSHCLKIS